MMWHFIGEMVALAAVIVSSYRLGRITEREQWQKKEQKQDERL